jgi:hypothetical protein
MTLLWRNVRLRNEFTAGRQIARIRRDYLASARDNVAHEHFPGPGMKPDLLAKRAAGTLRSDPNMIAAQPIQRQ